MNDHDVRMEGVWYAVLRPGWQIACGVWACELRSYPRALGAPCLVDFVATVCGEKAKHRMRWSLSSNPAQRRLVLLCTDPPETVLQLEKFGKLLRTVDLAEQRVASRSNLNFATVRGEMTI